MFLHDSLSVMNFWQGSQRLMLCSSRCIMSGYMMLICPITGAIKFGHLVKLVFAKFLYDIVNKHFVLINTKLICILLGDVMRQCKYPVSP